MRINSPKQTKASRANGSKSRGPKSRTGKKRVSQNAIRDGIFSRQVVIPELGETGEKFEHCRRLFLTFFNPLNPVERMLVDDFVENWWRRERTRRAETVELRNRLTSLSMRNELRRDDEVEKLRSRFLVLCRNYSQALRSQSLDELGNITSELEETRAGLISTTVGVDFLLQILEPLHGRIQKKVPLSTEDVVLVLAGCGFGSREAINFRKVDDISKAKARERSTTKPEETVPPEVGMRGVSPDVLKGIARSLRERDERLKRESTGKDSDEGTGSVGKSSASFKTDDSTRSGEAQKEAKEGVQGEQTEDWAAWLFIFSDMALRHLRFRKQQIQALEDIDAKSAKDTAIISRDISDRFARAETAVERRMYRALTLLAAMRAHGLSNLLPEADSTNQK